MLKKVLLTLVALGLLGLLMAWISGAFHKRIEPAVLPAPARNAGAQETDVVHRIRDREWVEVVGTLRAKNRSEVSPKIMAAIESISVQAGDSVEEGQVVVRLDNRELRARLEQARQETLAADESVRSADKDLKRYTDMLAQKVISQQEFDQIESRSTIARARLSQLREAVKAAETMLSYAEIRAPISGRVIEKYAQVGDITSPGRPLLAIYDPTDLRLEAPVPEALASSIDLHSTLTVRLETLNQSLAGFVDEIVPQAEAASRSVLVKVRVPELPGTYEGMFGRLLIPARERQRFCLARSAVRQVGQLSLVDVANPDGTFERRMVKLGEHSDLGRIEVLSGVRAGERVVLYGPPPPPIPREREIFLEEE